MDYLVKSNPSIQSGERDQDFGGSLFNFRFPRGSIHYGISRRDFVKYNEDCMFLVFLSRSVIENVADLENGSIIASNITINKPSMLRVCGPKPVGFSFGKGTEFIAVTAIDEIYNNHEAALSKDMAEALSPVALDEPGLFREIKRIIVKPYIFEQYRLEILEAMLYGALSYFTDTFRSNDLANQKAQRSDEHFIDEVDRFIDRSIDRNVSIKDIASHFGMSVSSLNSKFANVLNKSPHAFVIEKRIALAKRLLIETGKSIAEISLECGFSSQAHLSFTFKKLVGVTPRQFRVSARDSGDNFPMA